MRNRKYTYKSSITPLAYLALLLTFAVVIHTMEAMLPLPMPVPGIKIGLANIITLLTLTLFGLRSALFVAVMRSFIGSLFAGGLFSFGFWLSISAALASCIAMYLFLPLRDKGHISLISISIIGSLVHNIMQLFIASLIISNLGLLKGYYPISLLLSIPTGLITGLATSQLEGVTKRMIYQAGQTGHSS